MVSKILKGDVSDEEIVQQAFSDSAKKGNGKGSMAFETNLKDIQSAAGELVKLQESIKKAGKLTPEQQKAYADNLEKLGISAQNLAHMQQETGEDDFRLLFENSEYYLILPIRLTNR